MKGLKPEREEIEDIFFTYLKGLAMGAADSVPGVSGGTIAVITGIYERLIDAITGLRPPDISALRLHKPEGRESLISYLENKEIFFLGSLGAGVLTAIVILSRLFHYAIGNFRSATFAFFFGLIAASVVVLYSEIGLDRYGDYLSASAGFSVAFLLSGASSTGLLPSTPFFLFVTGLIAVSAMLLPGVSGSFILLILGQYEHLTGSLNRFVDSLMSAVIGEFSGLEALPDIISFVAGAIAGVFTISFIVRYMLDNYRNYSLVFLVSLMAGSLRLPVLEILENTQPSLLGSGLLAVPLIAGAVSVLALDRYTGDLDYSS